MKILLLILNLLVLVSSWSFFKKEKTLDEELAEMEEEDKDNSKYEFKFGIVDRMANKIERGYYKSKFKVK